MLAALVASIHDWQLAEDVLQDSVAKALVVWKKDGIPDSPMAWLITSARRRAIDHFRRHKRFNELEPELIRFIELHDTQSDMDLDAIIPDKRLELIFTCCHPALERKTQVALTLHTLGGLTTPEIAAAFLDKPTAMAQRLVRAKKKILAANIPFEIPPAHKLQERVSAVLSVLYLIFNEGYVASKGEALTRGDLSDESIRLTRIVWQLLPEECEVAGLLALMLLHDSRRDCRIDEHGQMISLEHQKRSDWDQTKIKEGVDLVKLTLAKQRVGSYQVQAAISAVHAESASWQATDWTQIHALYDVLHKLQPSGVVRVNQAVAMSYAVSIEAALTLLNEVAQDRSMQTYQPLYAARADMHHRLGNDLQATQDLQKAIEYSDNATHKQFLERRLMGISSIQ